MPKSKIRRAYAKKITVNFTSSLTFPVSKALQATLSRMKYGLPSVQKIHFITNQGFIR